MPINEENKEELAEKIEKIIQSTDFSMALKSYDKYLYEEMIKKGFEQKNMPKDIEPDDVEGKELKLTNNLSSDAWAELLSKSEIHSVNTLKRVMDNDAELIRLMLNHMDNNFRAIVEINESLNEIRLRKPNLKSLSNAFSRHYDKHEFERYIEEREASSIKESIREKASEEGISSSTSIDKVPYKLNVNLTKDFDSIAERYLEKAINYGNTNLYVANNLFDILIKEKAYKMEIDVSFEQLEA